MLDGPLNAWLKRKQTTHMYQENKKRSL